MDITVLLEPGPIFGRLLACLSLMVILQPFKRSLRDYPEMTQSTLREHAENTWRTLISFAEHTQAPRRAIAKMEVIKHT